MDLDDRPVHPPRPPMPAPLDDMSLGDLEDYIHTLEAEIARTRAHIATRSGQRTAAERLFRAASP
ncbi:DUF1192 domain-containing protein [Pararhodospirillum photometricum]|nr:DUF1192 domain-containing protein [Pararhodospirillum photometricum]